MENRIKREFLYSCVLEECVVWIHSNVDPQFLFTLEQKWVFWTKDLGAMFLISSETYMLVLINFKINRTSLIGSWLASLLCGIVYAQAYSYFTNFPNDSWVRKALVITSILFSLVGLVGEYADVYEVCSV